MIASFLMMFISGVFSNFFMAYTSLKILLPRQLKSKLADYRQTIVPNLETHLLDKFRLGEIEEMNELIERFLDKFMNGLKSQIPMGNMLFSPSLTIKIKAYAQEEIIKEIPQIKEEFIRYLKDKKPYEGIILQNIAKIQDELIEEGYRMIWKVLSLSLLSAFLVSLILSFLIHTFL